MKTILTIAKKELKAYFLSPIAYVYIITFLVVTSWLFFRGFFIVAQADMRSFFMLMPWVYLFFIPAVAMGKWSEEIKQGTMELLLTLPVKDIDVVAGKFIASIALVFVSVFLTLTIPVTVMILGKADIGPIIGGYIGLLFLGAAYLSIGLVISSLTENQIIAFILGVVACFMLLILGEPVFTMSVPDVLVGAFQYMGLATHFASIGRGVIDSRDIIYYASVIGFFVWLNLRLVEMRRGKVKKKEFAAVVASVVIVLFVFNFLSSLHFFRFDLTEDDQYTLSKSTKNLLKNLDDVVNIQIYFSQDLPPALLGIKRDVDDTLDEYRTYAGQKLKIQFINPQETPQEEAKVQMMGIPPVQLNVIQKDKQELVKVYLGMAIVHGDKKEVIPVIQGTGNLEYELTSAIIKISSKEIPSVVWLSDSETEMNGFVKELLKKRYNLRTITKDKIDISPEKDTLLIVTLSEDLTEDQLFQIDQYLMKGGKIFWMLDRASIGNNLSTTLIDDKNIIAWLENNKITVSDKFVTDRSNTHAAFSGGYVTYHVPYPFWLKVTREGFDAESPIVSNIESLILPWASPVKVASNGSEGVIYTIVAKSSPFGKEVDLNSSLMPESVAAQMSGSAGDPIPLIVKVGGKLKSFYAGKNKDAVTESASGELLVVGNTRYIQDSFLKQFRENSLFFENAVDLMAMGDQLVGIRSKGRLDRPLEEISSGGVAFAKYLNLLLAPFVMIIFGLTVLFLRRQKSMALRAAYKR